jgi:hypothetical protein
MLKLYNASVEFMTNESNMLGADHPHKEASQNARVKHFVSNLRLAPKDVDDSAATMAQLQIETDAFTEAHRRIMAGAISAHMSSDTTVDKPGAPDRQSHMFMHNYLPDTKWKFLYDKSNTVHTKLEGIVDFALEVLGLRHPNDATLKMLIAIVLLCHGTELSPDDFYEMLGDVKDKFAEKRPLFPGKPLLATYDRDPQQFMRLHPRQYLECDPPIASRLEERSIQQRTRKDLMPTRSTNKHLKKNKAAKYSTASTVAVAGADNGSMTCRLLDYVLGKSRADAPPALMDRGPKHTPPAVVVPLLAITDPGACGAAVAKEPPTVDNILAQARGTLGKKPKLLLQAGRSRRSVGAIRRSPAPTMARTARHVQS